MSDTTSTDPTSTDPTSTDPSVTDKQGGPDGVLGERADSGSAASKPAEEWVTGDEPMTAAQKSYLDTLAREAGEELPADLTKAQASEHIERLQQKTGRGQS